ncbi:tRNA pseudouridine(38-40) synthase TruA [Paenibacillus mucilaginosus]|uniref:tRNA pseudouridine synthase A n=1 Tax=Paenibacillus mucilaginosus (strain KNP414) TaxID=1036673 RepID=F8F7I3_PAEMK|nr:tRNA pseudouridine(38-40) synthase TruA [Paenibacillus mucilaginosus]AEI45992.1 tRNA pseudouridine synthase A [Paenibacillus mucilaginosus KNP414]MCG7217662.1 tRNA pseudouridine(38-40) synthase TruA [Paenibacillus mucilaginosus]WDM27337.1 tRNA pseudouridine(38-40) synthase TruA [Paenibacillus mucilaginosus]
MRNIAMKVSYDGTAYHGFQTQPELVTVQDELEQAILFLTGEKVKLTSSGRTDAGVHAKGQVINLQTEARIPVDRWCHAMNSRLPDDIVVWHAEEVPAEFHARRSAKRKTYRYTIRCGRFMDPFKRRFEFHHPGKLDVESMRKGLLHLIGEHDFTSYCSTRTASVSHVRTIYDAYIECEPVDQELQSYAMHIFVTGNGFLYNMVRIIVGTLMEVGEGKRSSNAIGEILAARNRSKAGPTAMAHGLMLWEVFYDKEAKKY